MTKERTKDKSKKSTLVDQLFEKALNVEVTARRSYLDRECRGLPHDIRQNVEDLLEIDAKAESEMEVFQPVSTNVAGLLRRGLRK